MAYKRPDELQKENPYANAMTGTEIQAPVIDTRTNQERANDFMRQIQDREQFQYDPSTDPLWQAMKDQYTHQGQRAMQDTLGQAAGLTGGYNSSYAQSVGQQQFNEYLTKLNAQLPGVYDRARSAYDAETQNLFNLYNMAQGAADIDYSRSRDELADQRYDTEWAQQQRAYEDDQAYRNWQMQQAELDRQDALDKQNRSQAYEMAMNMIATGQTPPADLLAAAGISADYARQMAAYYKNQAALAAAGGSGSRSGGSRSSGGGYGSGGGTNSSGNSYTPEQTAAALQSAATGGAQGAVLGAATAAASAPQYGPGMDGPTFSNLLRTVYYQLQGGNYNRANEIIGQYAGQMNEYQANQIRNILQAKNGN